MDTWFLKIFYKPNSGPMRIFRKIVDSFDDAISILSEYRGDFDVYSVELTQLNR